MKVIVNNSVYEVGNKMFRNILKLAKEQVPFGVYAVEKNGICEMRNDMCKSRDELNKAVVEYQKQGFKVYFNGKSKA